VSHTLDDPMVADRPVPPPAPVTFEEFLAWAPDNALAEWVDGEVLLMSPASAEHQRVALFLAALIKIFVEAHHLGEVFAAPFLMRLLSRPSGREPDILFVANEHLDRIQPTYLDGPADLAVEVVSPDSDDRDHGAKFIEYEAAGIPEYWLIDPARREGWFFQLGPDRRYHLVPLEDDGIYRSAVLPGFWLRVAWLWQRPLPRVDEIARQIAG
jgi:Uma2 family endonuclease